MSKKEKREDSERTGVLIVTLRCTEQHFIAKTNMSVGFALDF
jgi:hypothetical protein